MLARIFLCICFVALFSMTGGGLAAAADYVAAGEAVKVVSPKQDSVGDNVQTAVSREEAVKIARSLFPEMLEGKELQAELEDYMRPGQSNWRLSWNSREPSPFGPPEHIFIILDSRTGDLLNANFSMETQKPGGDVDLVSREEALQKAEEFVRKMRPEEFSLTRLDENRPAGYYVGPGVMKQSHEFFWQRYENGIRVEGDGIGAGVSALGGQVRYYTFSWHRGAEFPAPGGVLEAGALAGRVLDDPGLYLGYAVREGTAAGTGGLPEAFLVYQHNAITPFFDPHTGDALDAAGVNITGDSAKRFTALPAPVAGPAGADPPDAPKTKVSEDQAQKAAEDFFKKLGFAGAVIRSGGGSSGYGAYHDEYWAYSLKDDLESGGAPRRERQVMVNTLTGEASQYNNFDYREAMSSVQAGGKPVLTREQALDRVRDFIRLVNPGLINKTVLTNDMNIHNPKMPNEYNYLFTRLVNGIPFWRDGIEVSIDAANGEIKRYDCRWHQAFFPDPAGVIKAEEAKKLFMERAPIELVYFFPWEEGEKSPAPVLAYRFAGLRGDNGLDAASGQLVNVDWMGARPVVMPDRPALSREHWAYLPLALLDESGLLPSGEGFDPAGAVTRRDAIRVLIGSSNRYYGGSSEDKPAFSDIGSGDRDYQALQMAVRQGVFPGGGEFKPEGPISRETMAAWLVRALGHEEVAGMPARIELNVKDAELVDASLRNHVAIACGLGLMTGDASGLFRPQDKLTWAELATIATRAAPRLTARFNHW